MVSVALSHDIIIIIYIYHVYQYITSIEVIVIITPSLLSKLQNKNLIIIIDMASKNTKAFFFTFSLSF